MNLSKAAVFAMLLLFMCGFNQMVRADEMDLNEGAQTDYIKSRTYVGVVGISATIDQWGDFTGTTSMVYNPGVTTIGGVSFVGNPELDLIPTIQRNFGFGAMVGHREGPWAAELSYNRSDHTGTFYFAGPTTFSSPARLESFNLDFKRYFLTQLPTQPFISVGFSFPWLWMRQGSYIMDPTLTTTLQVNDETISGFGFNLGAGLEIYIGDGFSLIGGAYETWTSFDQISGASKIATNNMYFNNIPSDVGSLAGNGLKLYVGTTLGVE